MPEGILYTTGKPDTVGGPLQGSTCARKPVYVEGLIIGLRGVRQSGRPYAQYTVIHMDAGLCRRPYCIQLGSPTLREARYQDLHIHGSRSMPEALLRV